MLYMVTFTINIPTIHGSYGYGKIKNDKTCSKPPTSILCSNQTSSRHQPPRHPRPRPTACLARVRGALQGTSEIGGEQAPHLSIPGWKMGVTIGKTSQKP